MKALSYIKARSKVILAVLSCVFILWGGYVYAYEPKASEIRIEDTDDNYSACTGDDKDVECALENIASGAGQSNTASNTGSAGTGLFKQKTGVDLEFYKLNSLDAFFSVNLDGTDKIDFDVNWDTLNNDIGAGAINWTAIDDEIQTGSVNWESLINQEIQGSGINWLSLEEATISSVNWMEFNPIASPDNHMEGLIYYNEDRDTHVVHNAESDIEGNLMEEMWIPGRNSTGGLIEDSKAVYISGASGNKPLFTKAKADATATSKIVCLATHDIEDNSNGYCTTDGTINDIDTTGSGVGETWLAGDALYVSKDTAGELTKVKPTGNDKVSPVGFVLNAHATQGIILTRPMSPIELPDIDGMGDPDYTSGDILVADGVDYESVQMGGEATMDSSGNVTVTNNVTAGSNILDDAIVRGNGGAKVVQGSTPTVNDDGRIQNVTNPVDAQDAATSNYTVLKIEEHGDVENRHQSKVVLSGQDYAILTDQAIEFFKIQNDDINWTSLDNDIIGNSINWAAIDDEIQRNSINWDSLIDDIQDFSINWGTGLNQVEASDLPILDAGSLIVATEVDGALQENRTAINNNTTFNAFHNGTFAESFDALVTSNGTVVTLTVTKPGGGDLTAQFSSGKSTFTGGSAIVLTAGTDSSPQINFIYILESAPTTLVKSTTAFPTDAEHIRIGFFFLPSATYIQVDGAYINQNWNDHLNNGDDQGHLAHLGEWIRLGGAHGYSSGLSGNGDGGTYVTRTDASPDTVYLETSSGVLYQFHRQAVTAKDTSPGNDDFHVVNENGDAYADGHDLYDLDTDADGDTMRTIPTTYYNLVLWMVGNKTGEYSPLMINLPTCSYSTQAGAELDSLGCDVYSLPREFVLDSNTGHLIARLTMQWTNTGLDLELISTVDLRGTEPTVVTGGGGSGHDPVSLSGQSYLELAGQIITANVLQNNHINWTSLDGDIQTGGVNWESIPNPTNDYFLRLKADGSVNWEAVPGGGDIESVWTCTTGACNDLTSEAGDKMDAGTIDSFEIHNSDSDEVLAERGEMHLNGVDEQLSFHWGTGGEVPGEASLSPLRHLTVPFNPGSWYDKDTEVFLWTVGDDSPEGFTFTEWKVSCNVDPDVEMDFDLKYADAWIGLANSSVIDVLDTTNGVSSEDTNANINSGNPVPNGKTVYLSFGADPEGTCAQLIVELWGYNEED